MGLGIPVTSHFLVNDERGPLIVRITHLAWKILTTPSRYMSDLGIQNRLLFEGLEFGTCKFTWKGRYIPHIGRCGGLIWNNFGFKEVDAQALFPRSTNEG